MLEAPTIKCDKLLLHILGRETLFLSVWAAGRWGPGLASVRYVGLHQGEPHDRVDGVRTFVRVWRALRRAWACAAGRAGASGWKGVLRWGEGSCRRSQRVSLVEPSFAPQLGGAISAAHVAELLSPVSLASVHEGVSSSRGATTIIPSWTVGKCFWNPSEEGIGALDPHDVQHWALTSHEDMVPPGTSDTQGSEGLCSGQEGGGVVPPGVKSPTICLAPVAVAPSRAGIRATVPEERVVKQPTRVILERRIKEAQCSWRPPSSGAGEGAAPTAPPLTRLAERSCSCATTRPARPSLGTWCGAGSVSPEEPTGTCQGDEASCSAPEPPPGRVCPAQSRAPVSCCQAAPDTMFEEPRRGVSLPPPPHGYHLSASAGEPAGVRSWVRHLPWSGSPPVDMVGGHPPLCSMDPKTLQAKWEGAHDMKAS
ncbi:hypothetical protein MC885_009099 [Smutsia gigantea]|nr:hypothetical protein MC885_009099 [Smutsia gigantea]